jgi:cbb3-type cytochrome oxidase cytochrome c subunit
MVRTVRSDAIWVSALVVTLVSCHPVPARPAKPSKAASSVPTPISMAALHQSGGLPSGWRFTPPPGNRIAGRQVFVDFGCYTCHAVQGESFPATPENERSPGPDLTGMGSHHPPEYFVESILNPNGVVVDGPGYTSPDGGSIMPIYPDMTLGQLADLVSYLKNLKGDPAQHAHVHRTATSFLVRAGELTTEQFDALDDWFDQHGAQQVKAVDGLVSLETYGAPMSRGYLVISIFGFEDDVFLSDFAKRLDAAGAGDELSAQLHYGSAAVFRPPAVYRAIGLSVP